MQPRLFISHSSEGDESATRLLDSLVEELTKEEFGFRVDKSHIRAGVVWRKELDAWLDECDVAILLLSEKALVSNFVAYECSVLSFRAKTKGLAVIPVFLPPVDSEAVESSALNPSYIYSRQAVKACDEKAIVTEIIDRLKEIKSSQTPIDDQAEILCERLKRVADHDIRRGAATLAMKLGAWTPPDDIRRALAVKMMCTGLDKIRVMIRLFLSYFLDKPVLIRDMINLVATSWVDLRAAGEISSISTGTEKPRMLGVNAETQQIAETYVLRASNKSSLDSWKVASVPGIVDDRPAETLERQIRAALKDILKVDGDDDELEKELEQYDEDDEPVFVTLPAEGLNRTLIEQVRAIFPSVTLFVLGGIDASKRSLFAAEGVPLLAPALDAEFEKGFCAKYEDCVSFLRKRSQSTL
ncbi:MAG TPA: toll/interleukin-1 receptor domain-containing protein [Chthoniobacterales bacterium]|nr:toll/interleukin-1 receptor domain-containing protein [Chthoniobacterales bacterium]